MSFLDKIKGLFGSGNKETVKPGAGNAGGGKSKASKPATGKRGGKLDVATRFELDKHAFNGTMSQFRVARDFTSGKTVGLKFLDVEKSKQFEDRFVGLKKPAEGEIALQLSHKSIVETYEVGITTLNEPYILMEYIDGPGLDTLINSRSEKLAGRRVPLIKQMAAAIQGVHKAGFIHRDICPRNFICHHSLEWLKMIDFGLTVPDQPPFRKPGNRTGTPLYMAPEIVRRRATDKRVDIFAFGVTCYRMLVFDHPWSSTDTTGKAALKHDTRPPVHLDKLNPNLNRDLVKAVMACMEASPDDRPESMEHFLRMIRRVEHELE
ncbi:MAG: serine/threonine-protein kinase [Planctomycetota bacterium]|nr:serine/threonine-protein kinase [Planctomycetota bacterium]